MAHLVIEILEEKKAEDIILMDLKEVADFTDYFIICNGTSDRMLNSLADAVSEKVKEVYKIIAKREGDPNEGWLLVDLGDIVIHLFSPELREYYQLEKLWQQGKTLVHVQ